MKWCTDATTGGARPTREDATRWVHDNAMADGSCAPLAATLAAQVMSYVLRRTPSGRRHASAAS
jgi:hypothetical protein